MSISRRWVAVVLALAIVGWSARQLFAGAIAGSVDNVATGGRSLSLKVGKEERIERVSLDAATEVTLDGKPATAADIKAGLYAVVITDDTRAVKVNLRSKSPTASAPTPKTTTTPPKSAPVTKTAPRTNAATANADAPWPQFRGPNRDGISAETGLLKTWPADGPKLLWTATGMGEGFSSVSVANGLVLTMGNQNGAEGVVAVDLKTGKSVWGTPTGKGFQEQRGSGPRAVPTIDGNTVYALGANGDLASLDLATGKSKWSLNILQQTNGSNITWGISESVLIDGDRLICSPGSQGATMIALNKSTGRPIWSSSAAGVSNAGYASAIIANISGVRQYVQFTSQGVIGVKADDGTFLWADGSASNRTANCSAPVVLGNFVFSASGYGTGGALVEIGARPGGGLAARQVYTTRDMKNHHGGMVLLNGFLYGCDEAVLTCLDFKTGQVAWQNRSVGKGSVTYADGHLYVRSEQGPVALVEANPKAYVEKGRFTPPRSDRNAWAYPAIADGKLLLRDQDQLFCYEIK